MVQKHTLFKNLACLSFCLFTFFMASIFVSETYFNRVINDQIQELALLKSVHYQDWGKLSAPSPVIHKFQPYTYDQNGNATLFNQSLKYQYTFSYDDFSFTQGNTGNIRYLNNWKREPIPSDNPQVNDAKINVFNVEAEKVYNYDYYAPDVRRFALTYNIVFDMLIKEFLPQFYAMYIYEYLFKNQTTIQARVFDSLKISKDEANKIYTHQRYGLNSAKKLAKWIKLGNQVDNGEFYTSEFYQGLVSELNLSEAQIMYIAGPQSSMRGLLYAVKGAITGKLNDIDSDYCSDDMDDDGFCSPQKIIAAQLGIGLLTTQQLFPTVTINKAINQINATLLNTIEYRVFCAQRPDLKNCSGDANTAAMGFFGKQILANFTEVAYIFKNLDKPEAIEEAYDIQDAGEAMIAYVKFLYESSFNLLAEKNPSQEQTIFDEKSAKSTSSQLNDQNINVQAFKRSFTNYNHIQPILDRFQSLLITELYSRAFYNAFISTTKPKCEDYYVEDFEANKDDCQNLPLTELSDIRVYIGAFLGINEEKFMNETSIQGQMLYEFFHNGQKSLFAKQAHQIAADFAVQYNCQLKAMCYKEELFYKEWKDGSVLKNLPSPAYFPSKQDSITNWDSENVLKGVQPQLYKFLTVSPELNPSQILNSQTGIFSLFNLMKVYSSPQSSTYSGLLNSDLLYYLQTIVMQVQFSGIYLSQSMSQFFNTHKSQILQQKRQMNPQLGGAPWLSPNVSVLKLENQPQRFNYINSGIYNPQKLRSLSMIEDSLYSSSVYPVYQTEWEDVSVTYTNANKIKGTNLFGFQTKIQEHDSVEGYFDMIYQAQALSYKQSITWINTQGKEISAFKFGIDSSKKFNITVEQLTNKIVQLSANSYFIVEPNTGLTLEMYIKYTVNSKPFYTEFLTKNSSKTFPLYQGEIYYVNSNTDSMVEISSDQHTLKVLLLLGIIFSSVFLVAFIVMLVLYRKYRKADKFKEEKKSLMSGQGSNSGSLAD